MVVIGQFLRSSDLETHRDRSTSDVYELPFLATLNPPEVSPVLTSKLLASNFPLRSLTCNFLGPLTRKLLDAFV